MYVCYVCVFESLWRYLRLVYVNVYVRSPYACGGGGVSTRIRLYVYVHVEVRVYVRVYVRVRMYVCTQICVYVC